MIKRALLTISAIFSSFISFGQETVETQSMTKTETLLLVTIGFVLVVSILVLLVSIYALYAIRTVLLEDKTKKAKEAGIELVPEESIWKKLTSTLTRATPIEKEADIVFAHSYDGIRELDNHLPPWWKWLFFITIGWSAIYLLAFHVFDTFPLSGTEYDRQIARAEQQIAEMKALATESIDENNVEFTNEEAVLSNGKALFLQHCVVCHAADGGGGVGPNFTDNYWLHGGDIKSIFKVIKYGVPQKGMISWQTQLKPSDMRDLSCFITTLVGTTPVKPKEPQGELYIPESQPAPEQSDKEQVTIQQDQENIASR